MQIKERWKPILFLVQVTYCNNSEHSKHIRCFLYLNYCMYITILPHTLLTKLHAIGTIYLDLIIYWL